MISRRLNDWESDEYEALLNTLSNISLEDGNDYLRWILSENGLFSVKSWYSRLVRTENDADYFPYKQDLEN